MNWNTIKAVSATCAILIIVVFAVAQCVSNMNNRQNTHNNYFPRELTIREQLDLNCSGHINLLNHFVFEGTITNKTNNTYKDAEITIEYYSKTGTFMEKRIYMVYEYFPPGTPVNYKFKEKSKSLRKAANYQIRLTGGQKVN